MKWLLFSVLILNGLLSAYSQFPLADDIPCTDAEQCTVAIGSECPVTGTNKVCECTEDDWLIYVDGSTTECFPGPGAACSGTNADADCEEAIGPGAECSSSDDICSCKDTHVVNEDEYNCLERANEANEYACEEIAQCADLDEDIECDEADGVCKCTSPDGEVLVNEECMPAATYPEFDCEDDAQCTQEDTECGADENEDDVTCRCTETGHIIIEDGTCVPALGAICPQNIDCAFAVENSECEGDTDTCVCEAGFTASPDSLSCVTDLVLGELECENDAGCGDITVGDATCSDDVCVCDDEAFLLYVESAGEDPGYSCLPGIGATCVNDADCSEGIGEGVECSGAVGKSCKCENTYIGTDDNSKCLVVATEENGYECKDDVQCSDITDAECNVGDEVCECTADGAVIKDGACVAGLGSCESDDDCDVENSFCGGDGDNKVCECNQEYMAILDNTACGEPASSDNEYSCLDPIQCNHIADFSPNAGDPPVAHCHLEDDVNTCMCGDMENYKPQELDDSATVCAFAATCDDETECEIDGTTCVEEICTCAGGSFVNAADEECQELPSPQNSYTCETNTDCYIIADHDDTATCETVGEGEEATEECQCSNTDDFFVYESQESSSYVCARYLNNDDCSVEDNDCLIDNSYCVEDFGCKCVNGYSHRSDQMGCKAGAATLTTTFIAFMGALLLNKFL